MAINKKQLKDEVIKTRKDEVRFSSTDPKKLLNNFLVGNLCRKWNEDFVDQETQKTVTIERTEIILEKGVCLNSENMQKVLFHMQTGDITEPIEVSNQSRLCSEAKYSKYPYMCKVGMDGETWKFLLEAKGVSQVLDIVKDWCELKGCRGTFAITEVKAYDSAVILVDRLRHYSVDEASERYANGEIPFEEFMNEDVEDYEYSKPEEDEERQPLKFYQIKAAVAKDGEKLPSTQLFVVIATDADRAILTINAYLQQKQREHNAKMMEQNRPDEVEHTTITASIEESKIVNFTRLIPDAFCKAYYSEEN